MSFDLEKANIVKSLILTRAQAGATLTEIKGILYYKFISVIFNFFLFRGLLRCSWR